MSNTGFQKSRDKVSEIDDFENQADSLEEWAAQVAFGWKKVKNIERVQSKISDRMAYLLWKRYGDDWENQ